MSDDVRGLSVGDRAPTLIGANSRGRFYSSDAQAGRPVMLACLGNLEPEAARGVLEHLHGVRDALAHMADVVALAPLSAGQAHQPSSDLLIHPGDAGELDRLTVDGAPTLVVLDRGGRIVHLGALGPQADIIRLYARLLPQLASEPSQLCTSPAPVLAIPNLLARDTCRALIAEFEASPHQPGRMASVQGGTAIAKLDEGKKRRRDIELTPESVLHAEVVRALAQGCAPEIKRAFQFDVAFADRILLARYDVGGYFKRHRDNAAPQTAFRDFAVSINLNTHEYEGGALLFPEYNDHRHSPPAGGAIIFSASLLHEAAPVTRGTRYVLLSFLSAASAAARMVQAA